MQHLMSLAYVFTSAASYQEGTSEPLQVGDEAPDFTLQDAEDRDYSLKEMRGTTIFLIMGNRRIRKEDDKWAEAFEKDYRGNDRVATYIVADMRSVPGFLTEGFVKAQVVKNKPPTTLLLDWEGYVHKAYRTQLKKPNLFLIDPEGKIAFHAEENFDEEIYQYLRAVIEGQ